MVPDDDDRLSLARTERHPILFGSWLEQIDDLTGELGQIDAVECGSLRLRLYACDPQQRGKDSEYLVEFSNGRCEQRMVAVRIVRLVESLLQTAPDSRQRRPQIVRDIVGNLPVRFHQFSNAVQHGVQIIGETVPFVA